MALISFTPEELEELKQIDAMIDADEDLTDGEITNGHNQRYDWECKTSKKQREYSRQYYLKHREEINKKRREYYASHREEIKKWKKEYYERNREEILAYQKKYYQIHRRSSGKNKRQNIGYKAGSKEYQREYLRKNPEKVREYNQRKYKRRMERNDQSTGTETG